jgi:uncharacterized membrane protein YkvA (DUF1232 family)
MVKFGRARFVIPKLSALRRFLSDKNAATWKKLLLLALALYIVFPLDVVPDFIPLWGILDDAAVLSLGMGLLSHLLAPYSSPRADASNATT